MRLAFFQRDIASASRLVPFATSIAAVVLSVVPVRVPGLTIVTPAFALMAVYHWSLYRPDLLPASGVFVIGLMLDLLNGTPYLGLSSLTLLVARSLILSQRALIANQAFPIVWAAFLALAALITGLEWLMTSVLSAVPLGSRPFAYQAVVTAAIFPIGSYLLAQAQRAFLQRG